MPVINANHTGATKTTMFGQPSYSGYRPDLNSEGVAHAQPPSQEHAETAPEAAFHGYPHSVLFGDSGTATAQPPSSASHNGSTQVYRQAATGENEVPGWIAAQLKSGAISSYQNPNTHQTFVYSNNGIHAVGSSAPAQITTSKTFAFGGSPSAPSHTSNSTPAPASPSGASAAAKASGSGIPLVDYHTFGTSADISFPNSHSPNFTVKVNLPNGQTFTYSGSTEGVPLGTVLATDQAVDQAWNAYLNAQSSLNNVPAGSSITVTQGNNGLNLNINAAPGTSLPKQTITIAPGLTMTEPTPTASAYAAASLLGTSGFMNNLDPGKTYTSNGITFTGSQLQNMYENYEGQISTTLTQDNPSVTVGEETANFNALTPAQQQQYVQQETNQYLQNLQYNGAGYYNVNGKNAYISNPDYYSTLLGNGTIGEYEGAALPQAEYQSEAPAVTWRVIGTAPGTAGNAALTPLQSEPSYGAFPLSLVSHTPASASVQSQASPLTTGMFPSGLPSNILASYLQPYLNTGAQDINNFLSGIQNGINQWANTPYQPTNPLSTAYWENILGHNALALEHPFHSVASVPSDFATAQRLANEAVQKGYAPWYFPDVTLGLEAAPLAISGVGGAGLASAATGGTVATGLGQAAALTGIGSAANYGINGLLRGQWTGPQAVQNAEIGALTAAILSPLAASPAIKTFLASKGITGLAGQILNNIPVFGSWSALNAGLSSEAQGHVPTPAYLGENFGLGALAGTALPVLGSALSTAFPSITKLFTPTLAAPTDYQTVLGVNPEAENVGVTVNPSISEATTGAENGPNAQLLKGSSYTQVTEKVYPNLLSRLLGRTATYQYLVPNLPEDLIQAGSEGIGTTEAVSAPLYVRGPDGVWNYVTDVKIDPQVAISKLSDALKADYNIANPEEATTETLPEIYRGMQDAAEGKGIPFEGKIYQLDDFIKAVQGKAFENSNLPAIIGKDGEPLTPKEVTQLIFDLKAKPPTDFIGTMWRGIVDKNPAIISEGTIYSQPSLFQRLLGNTQQNPQATFMILTLYLQRAAAEDSDIPAGEGDAVAQDTALKLTNNMIALQKAINAYLTSGAAPNMLPAGSAMPLLTAGMNELESRLFSDLVSQGFLDPQGNHVSNPSPAPTSGGTQAGNEGYIYIHNPDGTVTIQKVIQNPKEEQGEKELTKEEQHEAEKEENKQMQHEEEGQEQQTQITEPGAEEGIQITEPGVEKGTQVTEPGTSEVQITEPGQEGKEGTGLIDLEGQKEGTKGENKAATTDKGAEAQEGSTAEKEMQGQPIRIISPTVTAQKTIPVEIEKEAEQTATTTTPPPPPPIGQKFKEVEPIVPKPNMFTAEYSIKNPQTPAYTSVYNPSLYTVLFPNSNAEAIANYNPLFPALSQRPFQNPVTMNKPIATTTSATAPETSTTTTSTPEATTTTPQYAPTSAYDYISPQALMNVGNALPSHGTPQEQQVINNINTALQSDQLKQGISNYFNARYPQMGFVYPTSLTQPTVEQYLNNNPTYAHTFLKNALPSLNAKYPSQSTFSTSGDVLYNKAQNPYTPANAFSMLYGNAGLNQPISDYMQQLGAQNVMNALMNANRGYSMAEVNGLLNNPNYFGSLMGNPAFANMYAPGLSNGYFGNPNLNLQGNLQEMASQLYNNGYIMTPQNTPAWYAEELAQIGAITPEEANYLLSGTEGEPIPTYIGPVQLSEPEAEIKKKKAVGLKV